jgi:hypothetical protein
MRGKSKQYIITVILGCSLCLAIIFIVFQNYPALSNKLGYGVHGKHGNSSKPPLENNFSKAVSSFLAKLEAKQDVYPAQVEFYRYLEKAPRYELPTKDEYFNSIDSAAIPQDYEFYFTKCVPDFLANLRSPREILKGQNIVFSQTQTTIKKADILFNTQGLPLEQLLARLSPRGNRLILTGTYTSPYMLPAGLAYDHGKLLNPCMQKWEGLFIIDRNFKPHIINLRDLSINFTHLHIFSSLQDYLKFNSLLRSSYISAIQSHLIIYDDSIRIEKHLEQPKGRRRAIFETADGGIHVYDSFEKEFDLYGLADYLRKNYKANRALNLDMGEYNFCQLYLNNVLAWDHSTLNRNVVLSNFIILEY